MLNHLLRVAPSTGPDVLPAVGHATTRMIGTAAGAGLAAAAGVRRDKSLHPRGVACRGRLVVVGTDLAPRGSTLLSEPAEHDVVVRLSRSVGLPGPLPDLLGLSLRVPDAYGPDAHQDLLLISGVDVPVLHHLLVPARDPLTHTYTSAIPYRAGDETVLVGALPDRRATPVGGDLDDLARAVDGGDVRFRLSVARRGGRFHCVARLELDGLAADELDALRFDPANTGGGLQPMTPIADIRRVAYPIAQRGWGRTARGADADRAEAAQHVAA